MDYYTIIEFEILEEIYMLKIPVKTSIWLSIVFTAVFMILIVFGLCILPEFVNSLILMEENLGSHGDLTENNEAVILTCAYLILIVAAVADVLLFVLLRRVSRGEVFTLKSVAIIRFVSWCCVFESLLFLVLALFFILSSIVSMAALFLAIVVRVVKNVIEQATVIKQENDLTV